MMTCVCGSDYYAMSFIMQTNPDGRANLMADDHASAPWVMHLSCAKCGTKYVADPSSKALHSMGSAAANTLLDKYRIDFNKSFDPRQNMEASCPGGPQSS